MKLADLEYAPELTLLKRVVLHRVQRARGRLRCVAIGPLRLAPTGLLKGRFDLPDEDVGHFAEDQVTAVLEAVALLAPARPLQRCATSRAGSKPSAQRWPRVSMTYAAAGATSHLQRKRSISPCCTSSLQGAAPLKRSTDRPRCRVLGGASFDGACLDVTWQVCETPEDPGSEP
jgi:hypothetical protein